MIFRKLLCALASLRLTVALLALFMVLIFAGTLAQAHAGVWQIVDAYFRGPVAWIDLQMFVPPGVAEVPWSIPFPGGFTLALMLIVNLLAAHAVRFRFAAKKAGILILHLGLIVLLAGEFVTGLFAEEGLMAIDEGATAHYVEDIREVELALIAPQGEGRVGVTSVPQSLLESAAKSEVELDLLDTPLSLHVEEWLPNARLLKTSGPTTANQGVGREAIAEELPRARGVDGGQTDAPAATVTLLRDGQALGTWLLWAGLVDPQTVELNGEEYGLALRYRRTYKPYALHLLDFRHDRHVGTNIAKNFSSRVRLIDPETNTHREVLISMNNPLRYRGDTFYQASYKPDGTGTILQVVRNPGALLPYVACALVAGGLLFQFGWSLFAFLRRRGATSPSASEAPAPAAGPGRILGGGRLLPWAAAGVAVLLALSALLRPGPATEFDLDAFGRLPVTANGRLKPMDTAARHLLKMAGGRETAASDDRELTATQYALALMTQPESIQDIPVVRVDHPGVLALLEKAPEEGGRLPLSAIEPHWSAVAQQASQALAIDRTRRDLFQRSVIELHDRVSLLLSYASMREPYLIPPHGPGESWRPFHDAFLESRHGGARHLEELPPGLAYILAMMTAHGEGDAAGFNSAVQAYETQLERDMPGVMRRMSAEVLFNRASPFLGAMAVYVLAFLLLAGALLSQFRGGSGADAPPLLAERLRVAAVGLLWGGFLVHTLAIVMRVWLQDRPPVTNLYSSAIFVGWAAVLTALLLERLYRLGVAALAAAAVGFATLVVAHNLGSDGDTMPMMQAVLDSNFWLATHVVTITLGYSATFLAGTLATAYIVLGVFTRHLTPDRVRGLGRMVYGTVCFALLLSFTGTVLGGIWADQSWGRFWGWDPKENGAALVVLITAIILHARWGGLVRARGIMVLAVAGNIVTAWSWFGTNMLGVGLHSYGFMDSAVFWLMVFVASQLLVMAVGLTPPALWRSPAQLSRSA
ncbi:MAG: cytochrome c biogenesis protein CcsA [Sumerlaeia bacterium]